MKRLEACITEAIQSRLWRRAGVLAIGTMVSHALLFLTFPIVGFLYTPDQFGEFALYGAFLAFGGILATLRFEMAIPIAQRNTEIESLVSLSLLGTLMFSSLLLLVFSLLGECLVGVFGSGDLKTLAVFLAMGCAAEGTVRTLRAWNLRHSDMSALATAKVSQSSVVVAFQLLLCQFGHVGLYLSDVLGRLAASLVHLIFSLRASRLPVRVIQPTDLAKVAVNYRRFPMYSTWATLCIQFVDCSPLVLLAMIYSSATSGAFAMAHRAVLGPLLVISLAITQAYIAEGSELVRGNPKQFYGFFKKTAKRMVAVGGISVFVLAGCGSFFVVSILDPSWHQAGNFMLLLSPAILGQFVVGPIYQTLDMLQKQTWALVVNAGALVLVLIVFACARRFMWAAEQTVGIYSVLILLYNSLLFLCAVRAVQQFHDTECRKILEEKEPLAA